MTSLQHSRSSNRSLPSALCSLLSNIRSLLSTLCSLLSTLYSRLASSRTLYLYAPSYNAACRVVSCGAVSCRVVRTSSSRLEPCSVVGMSKVQTTHRHAHTHTHTESPLIPSLPPADRIRTSVRTTLIHGIFYSPPSVLPSFRPPACRTRVESRESQNTPYCYIKELSLERCWKKGKGDACLWGIYFKEYIHMYIF